MRSYAIGGKKPDFDFEPRDNVELCENLGLIDYERGVKLGGANFWLYKGEGALLEWGLLNYFIAAHGKGDLEAQRQPGQVYAGLGAFFFCGIDQNIFSHHHRSPSKSPETTDSARVAHIPDTLAALRAACGPRVRF